MIRNYSIKFDLQVTLKTFGLFCSNKWNFKKFYSFKHDPE